MSANIPPMNAHMKNMNAAGGPLGSRDIAAVMNPSMTNMRSPLMAAYPKCAQLKYLLCCSGVKLLLFQSQVSNST
jgi:hypothetical protein